MVPRYRSSRLVVHEGLRRSMEPFVGSARSILRRRLAREAEERTKETIHGVYVSGTESTHTSIVVQGRVDAVHADGVDSELLKERNIARASSAILEGVDERRGLREGVVRVGRGGAYRTQLEVSTER